jgi:hypothetical protein
MHASTKLDDLIANDEAVKDPLLRMVGRPPDIPLNAKLALCRDTQPDFDHVIKCCNAKGEAGSAGGFLKRAIILSLKMLDGDVRRKPERSARDKGKVYGDAFVLTNGKSYVVQQYLQLSHVVQYDTILIVQEVSVAKF